MAPDTVLATDVQRMSDSILELTIDGMAYGGDAFGREPAGRMVFVPFAAPGERVRVRPTEIHRSWARAALLDILEPSPARVRPRCRHFGLCGGCHYQHLAYPAQLDVKAEIVRAQLRRLGGFHEAPVEPTVPSSSPWNTRNHLQFSLDEQGRLGFQQSGSNRVIAIDECYLPEPVLADLWPRIDLRPIPGLERVALRADSQGETMILLEADHAPDVEAHLDLETSLVWLAPNGITVLAGTDHLTYDIEDLAFRVSPGSFFQVHTSLVPALIRQVLDFAAPGPGQTVCDLYAGVGLFSAFAARAGAAVVAVEQAESACRDFEVNLHGFDEISLYEAPVEWALSALTTTPDTVIADPPRSGLGRLVTQALIDLQVPRLVIVSCHPAALARDGQHLARAGYTLRRVVPFDLFPQTYHIETVSLWER